MYQEQRVSLTFNLLGTRKSDGSFIFENALIGNIYVHDLQGEALAVLSTENAYFTGYIDVYEGGYNNESD